MKISAFQLTRYVLAFMTAVLVIFGVLSLLRIKTEPAPIYYVFYAAAMFADAALMFFCYYHLGARKKWAYKFSFSALAVNIALVIFDQVGFVDIAFMGVNLAALIALYFARKEFS